MSDKTCETCAHCAPCTNKESISEGVCLFMITGILNKDSPNCAGLHWAERTDSVEQVVCDVWKLLIEHNDMLVIHANGVARPDAQALNEISADVGKIRVRLKALGVKL